ncbi:hypothetical protein ACFXTI_037083 [Malus domestica]
MKTILSSETTDIPDGVKIKVHAKIIEIEGSCGNLICNFKLLLQIMELSNSSPSLLMRFSLVKLMLY